MPSVLQIWVWMNFAKKGGLRLGGHWAPKGGKGWLGKDRSWAREHPVQTAPAMVGSVDVEVEATATIAIGGHGR